MSEQKIEVQVDDVIESLLVTIANLNRSVAERDALIRALQSAQNDKGEAVS